MFIFVCICNSPPHAAYAARGAYVVIYLFLEKNDHSASGKISDSWGKPERFFIENIKGNCKNIKIVTIKNISKPFRFKCSIPIFGDKIFRKKSKSQKWFL